MARIVCADIDVITIEGGTGLTRTVGTDVVDRTDTVIAARSSIVAVLAALGGITPVVGTDVAVITVCGTRADADSAATSVGSGACVTIVAVFVVG